MLFGVLESLMISSADSIVGLSSPVMMPELRTARKRVHKWSSGI